MRKVVDSKKREALEKFRDSRKFGDALKEKEKKKTT